MQKISTFLWFNQEAEEAVAFYTSLFSDSETGRKLYQDGKVLTIDFKLAGQEFTAMNGGPMFTFNEAVSLVVKCETQEEIDTYWNALTSNGGEESMCGWLKDKYGLSWQIVPPVLINLLMDPDRDKANRVMKAMMTMRKLNIRALTDAAEGKE